MRKEGDSPDENEDRIEELRQIPGEATSHRYGIAEGEGRCQACGIKVGIDTITGKLYDGTALTECALYPGKKLCPDCKEQAERDAARHAGGDPAFNWDATAPSSRGLPPRLDSKG